MARITWLLIVGVVLSGMASLALAVLHLLDLIHGSWTWILLPVWGPLTVSAVFTLVLLGHRAFERAQQVLDDLAESDLAVR